MDYSIDFNEINDILKEAQVKIAQRKTHTEDNNIRTEQNANDDDSSSSRDLLLDNVNSSKNKQKRAPEKEISTQAATSANEPPVDLTAFFEQRMTKWEKALDELANLKANVKKQSEEEQKRPDEISLFSASTEPANLDGLSISLLDSDSSSKPSLSPHVTGFTKCGQNSTLNNPFCQSGQSPSQEWKDCTNKQPDPVHPICCGPSKVKPLFDSKIEKLENQIVKHCLEIKDTNILLGQCCRSKEVLECQKHALHNLLLKLCGKIKELEKKLHTIKMAICCPNMPVICTSSFDCREEIKNMRRIEDKIETCHNGLKHKECLLKICNKTVEVMKQDKEQWEKDMAEMDKIKADLQKQINDMKQKVCKKSAPAAAEGQAPSALYAVSNRFSKDKRSQNHQNFRPSQVVRRHNPSCSESASLQRRRAPVQRTSGNRRPTHSSQCDYYEEEEEQSYD